MSITMFSPMNSTGEVFDYSPVNSSLHNLPVNRKFMNVFSIGKLILRYTL